MPVRDDKTVVVVAMIDRAIEPRDVIENRIACLFFIRLRRRLSEAEIQVLHLQTSENIVRTAKR